MAKPERRGRPPGPCNARELAQRRGAAHKHGRYAATPARRAWRPCLPSKCPLGDAGFPCEARRKADAEGTTLEHCVLDLAVTSDAAELYQRAIVEADLDALDEINIRAMAGLATLHERQLRRLLTNAGVVTRTLYAKDGTPLGDEDAVDPVFKGFLELNKQLGFTARDQGTTRGADSERRRDDAIGEFFSWQREMSGREGGSE